MALLDIRPFLSLWIVDKNFVPGEGFEDVHSSSPSITFLRVFMNFISFFFFSILRVFI